MRVGRAAFQRDGVDHTAVDIFKQLGRLDFLAALAAERRGEKLRRNQHADDNQRVNRIDQAQVFKNQEQGQKKQYRREHLQKQKSYPVASEKESAFSRDDISAVAANTVQRTIATIATIKLLSRYLGKFVLVKILTKFSKVGLDGNSSTVMASLTASALYLAYSKKEGLKLK